MTGTQRGFWRQHPGLVWSNPDADDSLHIRAALLRPRFGRVLDIALEFGLERVRQEWDFLKSEQGREVERAQDSVERILHNIEEGFKSRKRPSATA